MNGIFDDTLELSHKLLSLEPLLEFASARFVGLSTVSKLEPAGPSHAERDVTA